MHSITDSKYKNLSFDGYFNIAKIKWFVNALNIGKSTLNIALCEHTNQIAFMDNKPLKPMIVRDVNIFSDGICQDTDFCLCLSCEYNHNNYKKYSKAIQDKKGEITLKLFKSLVKRAKELTKEIHNEFKEIDFDSITYFDIPFMKFTKN